METRDNNLFDAIVSIMFCIEYCNCESCLDSVCRPGKYLLCNNINRFLQTSNNNTSVLFDNLFYKKDDPILFNETKRFGRAIYNNLKGRIVDVVSFDEKIQFDISKNKGVIDGWWINAFSISQAQW